MAEAKFIRSEELLALLEKRHLVDHTTHRVVIDIKAGQMPKIYTESYGTPDLFVELITNLQATNEPHIPIVQPVEYATADELTDNRCPRCDSPDPAKHPAMQHGGEVQPCLHPWHHQAPAGTVRIPVTEQPAPGPWFDQTPTDTTEAKDASTDEH